MRKILPILIAASVLLTPLYPVYAQGPTPPRPLKASAAAALKEDKMEKMDKLETKLEDRLADLKERIATRAAALHTKLQKFKDKAKAKRVETLNGNLNTVNENVTAALEKNLTNISAALEKLKAKSAQFESEGKDVTSLKSEIAKVEAAWTAADTALKSQMVKDYLIQVDTEKTVTTDAKSARNTLRTDLKAVHVQILDTRKALAQAIKNALSLVSGGSN